MEMYSITNVENLKAFKSSMLNDEPSKALPLICNLMANQEKTLDENSIIEKKVTTTRRGNKTA